MSANGLHRIRWRRVGYSKQKISPKTAVSPFAEFVKFSLPRIKLKLSSGVFE